MSGSGTSGGVVINLKKDKWRKIYQVFTVRDKKLFYTVSFKLSDDYKLASQNNNDVSPADLGDVPGIGFPWSLPERNWSLIISGGDAPSMDRPLEPDPSKRGQPQTLTGRLTDLYTNTECVFLIAIPPGEGSVTLSTFRSATSIPASNRPDSPISHYEEPRLRPACPCPCPRPPAPCGRR